MAGLSSCCPARTFPTHFILHIFPIIFLPVTLSPNNFATKCGKPHLPPPAGLFSPSKNAPYFSPLPKSSYRQAHLVRLPLPRRAFLIRAKLKPRMLCHLLFIFYSSPVLKHLSAKRHPAFAPALRGFPLNRAAPASPLCKGRRSPAPNTPLAHSTRQPFMQSRRSPAPCDHLRTALSARSPAASSTTHTAPTNGKFYFPIPPNTPHHLPTFSRRALLPLPLPAGATAAPSLSNF